MAQSKLTVDVRMLDYAPVAETLRLLFVAVRDAREMCILEPDAVSEFLDTALDTALTCLYEDVTT